MKNHKILDCTLRDGGYYTNWDFDKALVRSYCLAMEQLPIDYVEIGYRSVTMNKYFGEYYYCPEFVMAEMKSLMPSKNLALILNEKDIRPNDIYNLLQPCKPYISLIRIAVDPANFDRAVELAKEIKELGFEVAFNIMYMSIWDEDLDFLNKFSLVHDYVDYFYMVDSFGGVNPKKVSEVIALIQSRTDIKLGFHGHNNLEMALINSLTAIDHNCLIIDSTITGMGRGAGNLKTELLLTCLDSREQLSVNYTVLGNIVSQFNVLRLKYQWGTNLPYMFSGAHSLPQKQVMEWAGMNRYSISSVLNALKNKKDDVQDNVRLPLFKKPRKFGTAVIIGGGSSAKKHQHAILEFIEGNDEICLIHAGVRNVADFINAKSAQYYALVGNEGDKLLRALTNIDKLSEPCIYPPFPRQMGTLIPNEIRHLSTELKSIDFTKHSLESPLSIAIQIALDLYVEKVFLVGFDGYGENEISQTQQFLASENQHIINDLLRRDGIHSMSLTPTKYANIAEGSIYSLL